MDMQNYTTPFANTGDTEEFSIDTDPSGKVSLEKGWTELYQLRPEEGGLFILRKVFNQMMKLVSTDTVTWKTQSFPNWIDDKGDGLPYAYPKNALVKYTDGNTYVSKVDNNTSIPTDTNNWVNFEDFGSLNINGLTEKITPVDTDNLALQETGGLLKKLSWLNLKNTLFDGAISLTGNGYIKFPTIMGGLILQWGSGSQNTLSTNHTLPIAFPNSAFQAVSSFSTNCDGIAQVTNVTKTQITIEFDFSTGSGFNTTVARYIVIGH